MTILVRLFLLTITTAVSVFMLVLLIPSTARAQSTGQISGNVMDESSGEPVIGANVLIVGTTLGASADVDGKYIIRRIPSGIYDVKVSNVGYATKTITGVAIEGEKPVTLNVNIAQETVNLKEVVVTADEVRSSEVAALAQRKRSSSISDGISAEQIRRSPDAPSGDA